MSDLISRQAAIDAIFGRSHEIIKMRIGNLPSAQPDADMIHLQKEQAYMQGWEDAKASAEPPFQYSEAYVKQIRAERDYLQELVNDIADPKEWKWIPCSERLPEEDVPVLVTTIGKWGGFVSMDWVDPYTHKWNRSAKATAWMPLPEPARLENV